MINDVAGMTSTPVGAYRRNEPAGIFPVKILTFNTENNNNVTTSASVAMFNIPYWIRCKNLFSIIVFYANTSITKYRLTDTSSQISEMYIV